MNNKTIANALNGMIEMSNEQCVDICEHSFAIFFCYFFSQYIEYSFAPYHMDFFHDCERLANGEETRRIWTTHRDSAKSSIAKIFVIWLIVYKKRHNIVLLSYQKDNSSNMALDIAKQLSENKKLISCFGNLYSKDRKKAKITKQTAGDFEALNGVWVKAGTISVDITRGLLKGESRPDFFLLDDIETTDTLSLLAIEKTKRNITAMFGSMSNKKKKASMLVLGNYLTPYGVIAWLEDKYKNFVRRIPLAIDGKVLWSSKFGETLDSDIIKAKRNDMGDLGFQCEMMLVPMTEADRKFKEEYFKHITFEEVMRLRTDCYITIDPAISKTKYSDYTGICINFVDSQGYWYIKAYQTKLDGKELFEEILQLKQNYNPTRILMEDFAYTRGLDAYFESEQRRRNIYLGIESTSTHALNAKIDNNESSKESRILASLLNRYQCGTIVHIKGECDALEQQLRSFPFSPHDDVLDALAYQSAVAQQLFNPQIL
jgi:Terminase RNaseH-like domain